MEIFLCSFNGKAESEKLRKTIWTLKGKFAVAVR
jgi:hypothetical protein